MKILHRWTNAGLWESDHPTMKETLAAAVASGSNLSGSNLSCSRCRARWKGCWPRRFGSMPRDPF